MTDRILTLAQVAQEKIVPLSYSALRRSAAEGDGPFYKVRGKWMVVESDLFRWVREGKQEADRRPKGLMSEVMKLRSERV